MSAENGRENNFQDLNEPITIGSSFSEPISQVSTEVKVEQQPKKEVFESRTSVVKDFLTGYKSSNVENGKKISQGQVEEIKRAIDFIDASDTSKKDLKPGLNIAKKIIEGRTASLLDSKKRGAAVFNNFADSRIINYITDTIDVATQKINEGVDILGSDEANIFREYLEVKAKTESEKNGAKELIKQIEEIKSGAKSVLASEIKAELTDTVVASETKIEKKAEEKDVEKTEIPEVVELKEVVKPQEPTAKEKYEVWFKEGVGAGRIKTKEQFVSERENEVLSTRWQESFSRKYSQLSPRQQERFNDLRVNSKIFSTMQADNLLASGVPMDEIENIKYNNWFSTKIRTSLSPDKPVSEDDFDKLVQVKIEAKNIELKAKIKTELEELYNRKQEESAKQFVKNVEAQKFAKEQQIANQKAEREKLKEVEKQAKIEKAQQIPDKERSTSLNELRKKWDEAILRYSKIKEINKALEKGKKTGEYKIRGLKGLTPEEAKAKIEEFKKELEGKNTKRSDEIIDIVNTITGRDFKKEARDKASEKGQKGMDLAWLTKEVQETYKAQAKQLGKKGKAPTATKDAPITPTAEESVEN